MGEKEAISMVLLTILLCTIIIGAVCAVIAAVIGGGVLLVMFGDVIVFVAIVGLIVKLVRHTKRQN